MNTPSAAQPERPPAGGTSASADDDGRVEPDRSESAPRPAGSLPDGPDRHERSGPGGDDEYDDDEYEPL